MVAGIVEAQERRPAGRVAPPQVYAVAPSLGDLTDEVLFGDVWLRRELAPRDRSVVTASALIAMGRTAQVGGHVGRALDNGVTSEEIGGIITRLAFHSGWPNTISAVMATREVFDARGIGDVAANAGEPLALDAAREAARAAMVDSSIRPITPTLADKSQHIVMPGLDPDISSQEVHGRTIGLGLNSPCQFQPTDTRIKSGMTDVEVAELSLRIRSEESPDHHGDDERGFPASWGTVNYRDTVFSSGHTCDFTPHPSG
ncbi:carboxymuconolactone decarboxylase family protein [Skermanella stibiiresistens]|uniref:carboxymuconolactone decarboxylase family protein n=1 Tax=Skermanella stibiiresistens TaxID=913326 RepID=UPI0004B3B856|nr:carboxymuconolactone decarboxylase family protein [Skermanella stibiiresistens]